MSVSAYARPAALDGRAAAPAASLSAAWAILACVLVGTFVAPLDISIVNIAVPAITVAYHAGVAQVEWVALAYLLTTSSLLTTHGRLADLLGGSRVYIAGMVLFALGSLACGLAPGLGLLVAARVVQALGAGAVLATGPAIITRAFPAERRGQAMGIHGMTVAVGLALGPFLGGLLVDQLSWRAIFLLNVPLALAGAAWAWRALPREARAAEAHFDLAGAFFLWTTLFALLLFLSRGQELGWQSTTARLLLAASVLGAGAFVWQERRSRHPMATLELFKNRTFAIANLSSTLSFMAMYGTSFLLPFYLMGALHQSAAAAGTTLAAMPAVMLLVAPFSGALSDRLGSRLLATAGLALATVAIALLHTLGPAADPWAVAARLALLGLGLGVFQAPNNSAIMGAVPRQRLGAAASMLGTMRHIGMVSGIAISGSILVRELPARTYAALQRGQAAFAPSVLAAYHHALAAALLFAWLATVTAALRGSGGGEARRPRWPARPPVVPTGLARVTKGTDE